MDGNFGSSSNCQTAKPPPAASSSTKSQEQSGNTVGSEVEEDSESDSESASSSPSSNVTALVNFREEWKSELKQNKSFAKQKKSPKNPKQSETKPLSLSTTTTNALAPNLTEKDLEEEAKQHFLMGVTLERQGDLYEAVRCYRRAIQMIPDIEFRISLSDALSPANDLDMPDDSEHDYCDNGDFESLENSQDESEPLPKRILRAIEANGWEYFQKSKLDYKFHFNDIPVEIITYILRWVISNDLDVRSLDVLSGVSRGFYCLCRDEQLWKIVCDKVWSSCNLLGTEFSTYREMFLTRTRVRLDGCYISKVTYVRPGEHSFQDQSYRPWHFVEYYRYIRFFPDGELYFLTTADAPALAISMLREKPPRNSAIMKGHYRLLGDTEKRVHCTAFKTHTYSATPTRHGGRNSKDVTDKTEFHMYFQIQDMKDKYNWILRWTYYAVYISNSNTRGNNNNNNANANGNGGLTLFDDFDISPTKFPPLYYSRVKSFTGRSESVLE